MTNRISFTKNLGIRLNKVAASADQAEGDLLVRGFFTSDAEDEVGDIITKSATEAAVPKYKSWGNVRYMHQPRPVGVVTRIGSGDGLEWNEIEIKVIDPQAKFEVEQGLLKALSVGIIVKNIDSIQTNANKGWIINEYDLAEISLVDHPANYDARLTDGEKTLPASNFVGGDLAVIKKAFGGTPMPANEPVAQADTQPVVVEETPAVVEQEPASEPVAAPVGLTEQDVVVIVERTLSQSLPGLVSKAVEEALTKALAVSQEPVAESTPEQPEEVPAAPDLSGDVAEIKSLLAELSDSIRSLKAAPAPRTAAVTPVPLPEEVDKSAAVPASEPSRRDLLASAVEKYLTTNSQITIKAR